MSLSAWEQQTLDSIKDGLAGSDPPLVALLTAFTWLASGEEMPARETIHGGSRRAVWRSRPRPRRHRRDVTPRPTPRVDQRLGLQRAMLPLLWLVITVALIAVAPTLSRGGGHGTCSGSWVTLCSDATSAPSSAPGLP